jgi:hypothetical protein
MQHIRLCAKHNDWKSGRGLCDLLADLLPCHARQAQVQDKRRGRRLAKEFQTQSSIGCQIHAVSSGFEEPFQGSPDRAVVLDYQDALHGCEPSFRLWPRQNFVRRNQPVSRIPVTRFIRWNSRPMFALFWLVFGIFPGLVPRQISSRFEIDKITKPRVKRSFPALRSVPISPCQ